VLLVNNIVRSVTRKDGDPLRCLTFCRENEKYLELLSKANCEIYVIVREGLSDWKSEMVPIPNNVFVLNQSIEETNISFFDCVIANDRLQEFDTMSDLSRQLHLPMITIDHASKQILQKLPFTNSVQTTDPLDRKTGIVSVSVDSDIGNSWKGVSPGGLSLNIPFYIDMQKYRGADTKAKKEGAIIDNNVADPIMKLFESSLNGVVLSPLFIPSEAPESVLRHAKVYVSTWSGLNLKLLEAMSSECIVVVPRNIDTESVIQDNYNGYLFSTLAELRDIVPKCLKQKGDEIGKRARNTIKDKYLSDLDTFTDKWNHVFNYVSNSFFSIAQ